MAVSIGTSGSVMRLEFIERKGSELQLRALEKSVKNRFKWVWLEEKDVEGNYLSDYIRKIDKITYGSKGKKAIAIHAARTSHQRKASKIKQSQKNQPALPALFGAVKALEDGSAQKPSTTGLPYGAPENVTDVVKQERLLLYWLCY